MVIRAILAVLWFPIGYLIRLYFVTLLEPTLNPIKLPLSSLAFKFMWLIPFYQHALNPFTHETRLEPHLGWSAAVVLTFGFIIPTLWLFPGVVAFFVWEMQGNWKLFRANRPPRLRPVVVGRRGEHMLQLLKPGFHTGTIPKLFAHLRYAERNAYHSGNWRSARTYRLALREAARSVQIFIEREFIVLLKQSKTWPDPPINFAQIVLSCNRIRIQLDHALHAQEPLWLAFEEHSGWLIGSIQEPGWSKRLLPEEREVMDDGVRQAAVAAVADHAGHRGGLGGGQHGGGRSQRHAPEDHGSRGPGAGQVHRRVRVGLLEVAEAGDAAAARAVVPQVEEQGVPAPGMEERDLLHHLDAGAVQPVHEDDRAPRLRRRHPPALEGDAVRGLERQVLVGEAERGRGETRVLAVVVDEAPGGGQAAQEVGDPAEHEEGKADRDNDGRRLEGPAGPHRAVTQRVGLPLMGAKRRG